MTPTVASLGVPVEQAQHASATSLRALAHPLRIAMLELLSRRGPQTSSTLGKMLDQPSGVTSYHLRQLARHGFIQEVSGKGRGRERWWERARGTVDFVSTDLAGNLASSEALELVTLEFERQRMSALAGFLQSGDLSIDKEWSNAAAIKTHTFHISAAQMAQLANAVEALIAELAEDFERTEQPTDKRTVQVHFDVFPVV